MRTRLAPTPSGFLHPGNALNFLIVHELASQTNAEVCLRIDDIDAPRCKDEYVQDIFDVLEWLQIPWTTGPHSMQDMPTWTQASRMQSYRQARDSLIAIGATYWCMCSRQDWSGYVGEGCPGSCARNDRPQKVPPMRGVALRARLSGVADPVIWRRDDLPAYHLASVVDDDAWGIDLIVRGDDLVESTHIQRALGHLLPNNSFPGATVVHHPLMTEAGRKLSKSSGSGGAPMPRSETVSRQLRRQAHECVARINELSPRSLGH